MTMHTVVEVVVASSWYSIVVDCHNPAALARWWAHVLDYQLIYEAPDEVVVVDRDRASPGLVFVPVPEGKSAKNRVHIDLNPDDQSSEVTRLMELGAKRAEVGQGEGKGWVVLADPEGNEFCVLSAR